MRFPSNHLISNEYLNITSKSFKLYGQLGESSRPISFHSLRYPQTNKIPELLFSNFLANFSITILFSPVNETETDCAVVWEHKLKVEKDSNFPIIFHRSSLRCYLHIVGEKEEEKMGVDKWAIIVVLFDIGAFCQRFLFFIALGAKKREQLLALKFYARRADR